MEYIKIIQWEKVWYQWSLKLSWCRGLFSWLKPMHERNFVLDLHADEYVAVDKRNARSSSNGVISDASVIPYAGKTVATIPFGLVGAKTLAAPMLSYY